MKITSVEIIQQTESSDLPRDYAWILNSSTHLLINHTKWSIIHESSQ